MIERAARPPHTVPVPVPCASSSWPSSSTSGSPSAPDSATVISFCCRASISACLRDPSSASRPGGQGHRWRHHLSSRERKPRGVDPCECCRLLRIDPAWLEYRSRTMLLLSMAAWEGAMTVDRVDWVFVMFVGKWWMERHECAERLTMAQLRSRTEGSTGWLHMLDPHAIPCTPSPYSL